MKLNFRELGTGYCPVLLSFASLLLLGSLALYSGGPALNLAVLGPQVRQLELIGIRADVLVERLLCKVVDLS